MAIQHRDRPVTDRVGRAPVARRRSRGGAGSFFRRWTLPTVGAITPILLIAVNIAAFIVHHLQTFRLVIALCAFVSGLMLNSWAGVRVYQWVRQRFPGNAIGDDSNQELLIIGGMAVVFVVSAATAWFCYQGLATDQNLPNISTFGLGFISIAAPVVVRQWFSRSIARTATAEGTDREPTR